MISPVEPSTTSTNARGDIVYTITNLHWWEVLEIYTIVLWPRGVCCLVAAADPLPKNLIRFGGKTSVSKL